jgi:hypothetical protein
MAGDLEGCGFLIGIGPGKFFGAPEFDALEQEIK